MKFLTLSTKGTPVNADGVLIKDSADGVVKQTLWSSVLSTLKTYFDPFYAAASAITGTVAIANSETLVTSYSAAADELLAGTTFYVKAYATQAGANAATPTVRVRIGTSTLAGNIAATLTGIAGSTAGSSMFEGIVTIRSTGAGGSAIGSLEQTKSGTATTFNVPTATVAVNTTVLNLIELTFISGNGSNTYTFQEAVIQKVK